MLERVHQHTHQLREVILSNVKALECGESSNGLGQGVELVLPQLQNAQPWQPTKVGWKVLLFRGRNGSHFNILCLIHITLCFPDNGMLVVTWQTAGLLISPSYVKTDPLFERLRSFLSWHCLEISVEFQSAKWPTLPKGWGLVFEHKFLMADNPLLTRNVSLRYSSWRDRSCVNPSGRRQSGLMLASTALSCLHPLMLSGMSEMAGGGKHKSELCMTKWKSAVYEILY